jgi:hypothetical protein
MKSKNAIIKCDEKYLRSTFLEPLYSSALYSERCIEKLMMVAMKIYQSLIGQYISASSFKMPTDVF